LESSKLSWRPGSNELTIVYGTNPTFANFKTLIISDNFSIEDIGDPVGQNNYFIDPKRVFWSPDGSRFATVATDTTDLDNGFGSNIWTYEMETEQFFRISNIERVGNFIENASWSSQGDKIAVGYGVPYSGIAITTYGNQQDYVEVTSETSTLLSDWPYVVDSLFEMFSKSMIYGFNLYLTRNSSPIWINNDMQILFVAADHNKNASFFLVNADGTGLKELSPKFLGNVALPTLASDQRTLAFIRYSGWKDRSRVEIATLDLITLEYKSLAVLPAPANGDELIISGLSWTPDGMYLAFSSPHAGESDIFIISRDGNSWANITQNIDGDAVSPSWKP
jgi:Tol biopolymer transport system component